MSAWTDWTQTGVGAATGAGPWVLALLMGRLVTRGTQDGRITDLKAAHTLSEQNARDAHQRELDYRDRELDRLAEERDYERKAKDLERERADANAERLASVVNEFGATTVHLLQALPPAPDA